MKKKEATSRPSKRKDVSWVAFIRPTVLLLTMVFLFTYVSFAWMRREWTPYVEQTGITIATSGSLVFQLEGDESVSTTGMSIVDILKLDKDFVLKPVSNRNGASDGFFNLDLHSGEGFETYQYLNLTDYENDGSKMGIENGYIEFQMMLFSPDSKDTLRYVYIHPDSHMNFTEGTKEEQKQVLNCIRVSVTLGSSQTIIFVPDGVEATHFGVNDVKDSSGDWFIMDGVHYYESYDPENPKNSVLTQTVQGASVVAESASRVGHFSDFNGGVYDGETLVSRDPNKTMFVLEAGAESRQWVTVRVWAEGTHEDCTDVIAGAQIDLKLKFASYTVNKADVTQ